jgi:hypothetical protein
MNIDNLAYLKRIVWASASVDPRSGNDLLARALAREAKSKFDTAP